MTKVFGYALIVGCVVWGGMIRFAHPELTETELFLSFWPTWLALTVCAIVGALVARGEEGQG